MTTTATNRSNSKADRSRYYDQHIRNPAAIAFYHSTRWSRARSQQLRQFPLCEDCRLVLADLVHHIVPFEICTREQQIEQSNLRSLCQTCHNRIHARIEAPIISTSIGAIKLEENELYYFDEEAAEKPIRFIRKFCTHYEGRYAGQPFEPLKWQQDIIRMLFGWKRRADNLRKHRTLYLMSSKGAGKTPLLAGILLFCLLGDGEPAAHCISMAASYEQANHTFSAGKNWINLNPELSKRKDIKPKHAIIEAPGLSKWTIVSGLPKAPSGPRPSALAVDELQELRAATAKGLRLLCANMFKRSQPVLLMASNAGEDRQCYAYSVHENASNVLDGTVIDDQLLPVIYEAPKEMDWRSEEAAKAANPSLGEVALWSDVKGEQAKGEAQYRRLFLSQWVASDDSWLDSALVRKCTRPILETEIKPLPIGKVEQKPLPLYLGLDMSGGDDLCSAVEIYVSPQTYFIKPHFWLPQITADRYEQSHLVPYRKWAVAGDIKLLDEPTISEEVQERIAAEIIALNAKHKIEAVCFDRAYTGLVIPTLEAAGIKCIRVGQGWGVSSGCEEFARRLIEGSIVLEPNGVMEAHCEHVRIKQDERGNIWPVKPDAGSNRYTGDRSKKIDGVQALVTGLTRAREHNFPKVGGEAGAMLLTI